MTDDIVEIVNGECEFCKIHDDLENKTFSNRPLIEKVKKQKGFQAIMGISGGADSCYLLYWAVKNGINPLVIHFDNGYNNPIAEHNMKVMIEALNVTFIRYSVPKKEYDDLNRAFIWAGVPEADIPNDMAMTAIMSDIADKYKIKYILNGHDFRSEGSTPIKWTYMDAKYIQSVYKAYMGSDIQNFPLYTFWKQIKYAMKGVKQIRPFYNMKLTDDHKKAELEKFGWKSYGPKHAENLYTEWVGYDYLPNNFGIDKRRVYLSARIRSGYITKEEAKELLKEKHEVSVVYDNFRGTHRTRAEFDTYDFKKYKLLLWVLAELKLVPWLFYKKYTK